MLGRKPSRLKVHRVRVRHACCLLTVQREGVGDINHSWISVAQVHIETRQLFCQSASKALQPVALSMVT